MVPRRSSSLRLRNAAGLHPWQLLCLAFAFAIGTYLARSSTSLDHDGLGLGTNAGNLAARQGPAIYFDCDQGQGQSHCRYIRPVRFFSDGKGYKYSKKELKTMGIAHPSLPSLTYLTWRYTDMPDGATAPIPPFPPALTYFHMRKAAGTTIEKAMVGAAKRINSAPDQLTAKAKRGFPWWNRRPKVKEKFVERCTKVLQQIQNQEDAKAFTVIRDPVGRFLSAVAQVLRPPERNATSESGFRSKCLKSTASETVRCVLNKINDKGMKFDVHFIPMAVNLLSVVRGIDIEIAVFQMSDLPNILDLFGAAQEHRERDSKNTTYTQSGLLSVMSVGDLDGDLIAAICRLYAIDVELMHTMSMKVPHCDG